MELHTKAAEFSSSTEERQALVSPRRSANNVYVIAPCAYVVACRARYRQVWRALIGGRENPNGCRLVQAHRADSGEDRVVGEDLAMRVKPASYAELADHARINNGYVARGVPGACLLSWRSCAAAQTFYITPTCAHVVSSKRLSRMGDRPDRVNTSGTAVAATISATTARRTGMLRWPLWCKRGRIPCGGGGVIGTLAHDALE